MKGRDQPVQKDQGRRVLPLCKEWEEAGHSVAQECDEGKDPNSARGTTPFGPSVTAQEGESGITMYVFQKTSVPQGCMFRNSIQ